MAEKIEKKKAQILERKLLAWPTFRDSTGFGNDPGKVVGSATSQTDEYKLTYAEKEEQDQQDLGLEVQKEFNQLNSEHPVKSAVGSSRQR